LPPTLSVPPTEAEVTTVSVLNVPLSADTLPSIIPLIEVIESRFICVSAETAATSVTVDQY
jgi:hypothetical protein